MSTRRVLPSQLRPLLEVGDPPPLRFGRLGSVAFLVVGSLLIVAWQAVSIGAADQLDDSYRFDKNRRGIYQKRIQRYFYFHYYTGLFPITTVRPLEKLPEDAEFARRLVARGNTFLRMEDYAFLQTGDFGKIFLLYPHAWWTGSPKNVSLQTFNRILGVGGLVLLFVVLSLVEHRLLAAVLVAVLGSNPYQLFELYARNNVFGYSIAVAILMLALHAPLVFGRWRGPTAYLLPLFSGAFLASVREVRPEPTAILLAAAMVYGFADGRARKLGMLTLLAASFGATSFFWSDHWERSLEEARRVVRRNSAMTFDGHANVHHSFWHPIWCGLGDFDTKYGYRWSDRTAYEWAIPVMNERFGTEYSRRKGSYVLDQYYTPLRKHRIKPETLPEYSQVLRDKVLHDIVNDPLWYVGILLRRAHRILTVTTPVRLGVGSHFVDVPFTGWLFLPALAALAWVRRWDQLQLLLFFLPTSLVSLLVYSKRGFTYNSAFHLALFALILCWLANAAYRWLAGRSSPVPTSARTQSS